MTKKATEILLELQQEVRTLSGMVRNIDNNMKLIIAKVNAATSIVPPPPSAEPVKKNVTVSAQPEKTTVPFKELPQTNYFEQMAAEAGVSVEEPGELSEETIAVGQRRGQRVKKGDSPRIVVSQQIMTSSGGPVFLAIVEVLADGGTLVKQTRTNNKGRWSAPLEPGTYTVNVVKRAKPDSGQSNLQTTYNITIPEGNKKYNLPEMVLGS